MVLEAGGGTVTNSEPTEIGRGKGKKIPTDLNSAQKHNFSILFLLFGYLDICHFCPKGFSGHAVGDKGSICGMFF